MNEFPALDTQPKVAAKSGMGQSTVSRILLQEQGATVDMLDTIAAVFGIQAWELLADSEVTRQAAYEKMIFGSRTPADGGDLPTMPPPRSTMEKLPRVTAHRARKSRPKKDRKPRPD